MSFFLTPHARSNARWGARADSFVTACERMQVNCLNRAINFCLQIFFVHPHLSEHKHLREKLAALLGEEELLRRIEGKKSEYADLLTDAGAIYLLALDNGLTHKKPAAAVMLKDVNDGMRGLILNLKVKRIFEVKAFDKNGKAGKVCRLQVLDENGTDGIVVLWNKNAELVERFELEKDDSFEIRDAFCRSGEIHSSDRALIKIRKFPISTQISRLRDKAYFDVIGRVLEVYEFKEFKRNDSKGHVLSFMLGDETGVVRVVAWGESAKKLSSLSPGEVFFVKNGLVKASELHIGDKAVVEVNPRGKAPVSRVKDLRAGIKAVVEGKLVSLAASEHSLQGVLDDGKKLGLVFPRAQALEVLGVKELAEDIKLRTVLELKQEHLLGSAFRFRGKTRMKDTGLEFIVEHAQKLVIRDG